MQTGDLTVGNPFVTLLKLSLPLLIGNLLFSSYTIISIVWVGQLLGKNELGAVAIGAGIISVILALGNGASTGVTVIIANYYGAKKYGEVKRVILHSILLTIIIVALMYFVFAGNLGSVLKWMNTPRDIFQLTESYVKVSILSTIPIYFYLVLVAILRGLGNVVIPMVFLGIATIINMVLDPLLILGIGPFPKCNLNGTAYASLMAQGSICIVAYIYVIKHSEFFQFKNQDLKVSMKSFLELIRVGSSTMIQRSIMSIGNMMVVSYVNALDVIAIAAFSAASNIDILITTPSNSISVAVSSMTGQCVGAGKTGRVKEICKWGIIFSIAIVSIVFSISFLCPERVLSLFTRDISVQETGAAYLRIVGFGYFAFAITAIVSGIVIGIGDTFRPMVFTLIGLWCVRIPVVQVLSKGKLGFEGICIGILVSNIVIMVINVINYRFRMSRK